ncbi:Late embryoproteinsis abundant protein Lea5-D [Hibiscus syriacus]|uniref:Late embryoproteinsis abundant protein Lea5-D n=1 Tax=Hibiscus syriacus TaxID=106335 RepID=A0A6A3AYP6_HIBSY|nr:phylloplanin-like [Hibiscus syriacus]KAE8708798.1 Late embryoproteinsis abundant protein Lea5-D [Hibiscus syriacus]
MAMAMKTLVFVCVLVAAMALGAPMAEAQLGGLISGLLGLIKIQGTLFCSFDGNMGANGTATPVFPNALVQLQCGGSVVSSSTTNGNGIFSILLDPMQFLVPSLLNNCNLAVKTPLSNCNASLPSVGALFSNLQLVGNTLIGLLNITNIVPVGFGLLRP